MGNRPGRRLTKNCYRFERNRSPEKLKHECRGIHDSWMNGVERNQKIQRHNTTQYTSQVMENVRHDHDTAVKWIIHSDVLRIQALMVYRWVPWQGYSPERVNISVIVSE